MLKLILDSHLFYTPVSCALLIAKFQYLILQKCPTNRFLMERIRCCISYLLVVSFPFHYPFPARRLQSWRLNAFRLCGCNIKSALKFTNSAFYCFCQVLNVRRVLRKEMSLSLIQFCCSFICFSFSQNQTF